MSRSARHRIGPGCLIALILWAPCAAAGPYTGENAGVAPTAAVWKGWVTTVTDVQQPVAGSGGYARDHAGQPADAAGAVAGPPAGFTLADTTRHVLSLGNGGSVVVGFAAPIHNGPGADFAVFENGFTDASDWTGTSREGATNSFSFAELARVEVATETSAWARFPCVALGTGVLYNLNNADEDRFASQDVTLLDGLAGKHSIAFGTPFDLAALTNDPVVLSGAVRLDAIRFVRLLDVVGDGSVTDSSGRAILDPFYHYQDGFPVPAPAASQDGFDLRGVGVLNVAEVSVEPGAGGPQVQWYAAADTVYQVERTDTVDASWQLAGPAVTGQNALISMPVDGEADARWYRVSRWAAP